MGEGIYCPFGKHLSELGPNACQSSSLSALGPLVRVLERHPWGLEALMIDQPEQAHDIRLTFIRDQRGVDEPNIGLLDSQHRSCNT
jgi:hypothetical protein